MKPKRNYLAILSALTLAGISLGLVALASGAARAESPGAGVAPEAARTEMPEVAVAPEVARADIRPGPGLGEPAAPDEIRRWDWGVMPDGAGLPAGSGTAKQGQPLYEQLCIACHGAGGLGNSGDQLAGAQMSLTSEWPEKTIGNYWPYATTLFDFIRRSKPMDRPGSLSADEVYALAAYLLYLNGIIAAEQPLDADALAKIRMPNRDGFIEVLE